MSCAIVWPSLTKPKPRTKPARSSSRKFLMSCRCHDGYDNERDAPVSQDTMVASYCRCTRRLESSYSMWRDRGKGTYSLSSLHQRPMVDTRQSQPVPQEQPDAASGRQTSAKETSDRGATSSATRRHTTR